MPDSYAAAVPNEAGTGTNCAQRLQLSVTGIVQGVGFRPYVYRLATTLKLTGFTFNHSRGVTIELQGQRVLLSRFVTTLTDMPPPLARIDSISQKILTLSNDETGFSIHNSEAKQSAQVAVSADKSSCSDCIRELNDPGNRHYRYPFVNCTNCGPRYTLINALPYDRPNTSMGSFTMCQDCQQAYDDPLDRRYHAQPVSCPRCGPQIRLFDQDQSLLSEKDQALTDCVTRIKAGEIVAIKGLGGFHLVCDATHDGAVERLRARKNRPKKPFALMCQDIEMAQTLATGSEFEWQLLVSAERPITLLQKRNNQDVLSPAVAPDIDKLGVFLPYTPLHQLLMQQLGRPLVATSANRSGEPIICHLDAIYQQLGEVVDAVLDHNRPILNGCDDSVVQAVNDQLQVLRLARGYAPLTLPIKQKLSQHVLAVGAQQKNCIAFGFAHNLVVSPHIGDLFSLEAEHYFRQTLATFERLYQLSPQHIIFDRHPDYATSRWSQNYLLSHASVTGFPLQHHYAHLLSVMAVNDYSQTVLGFTFDGTGLGDDGRLWGGEALLADTQGYRRIAQLAPITLIGHEQAIKDPRRIMLALLFAQHADSEQGLDSVLALDLPAVKKLPQQLIHNLYRLWKNRAACIETSSIGRLFDGVAAMLGLIEQTQFEGQGGMLLETAANRLTPAQIDRDSLQFELPLIDGVWQTNYLLAQIITALQARPHNDLTQSLIAKGFMDALAVAVTALARQYSHPVALCGGVFQNRYLLELCQQQLAEVGCNYLASKQIPINDGGIALGQLWYGIHQVPK